MIPAVKTTRKVELRGGPLDGTIREVDRGCDCFFLPTRVGGDGPFSTVAVRILEYRGDSIVMDFQGYK